MSGFRMTDRQNEIWQAFGYDVLHTLLYGGARSGKTFLIVKALVSRAIAHRSRHAILRYRFNHLKSSIVYDTLPKVMDLCFPQLVEHSHLDKSDWFYSLPAKDGGHSELWFGGLDDKERTEKILGNEYATLYLNECSTIPLGSRNIAITRLAQNTPLRLRAFYDCNPPGRAHWTHKLFIDKIDPERRSRLADPQNYQALKCNPEHNISNLPADYLKILDAMPARMRQRFLLGEFASETDSPLWTVELLDQRRILDGRVVDYQRIIISVDPSGASGPEDERSDEIGIIVQALGTDQRAYVLEDLSGRFGPREWGTIVADAYERHGADLVVAETNFGGAMVGEVIRAARAGIPFKEVKASRGKVVRAEPIATLFEKGKVSLVGYFPELEDQLCSMSTSGYMGPRSPDRADALVWGLAELFPSLAARDHNNTSSASRYYQEAANAAYDPFNPVQQDYDPYRRDDEFRPFS